MTGKSKKIENAQEKKSEELKKEIKNLEAAKSAAKLEEQKADIRSNIRLVRFYQSVCFEKKLGYKQLSYNMDLFSRRKDVNMSFDRELGILEVVSDKAHIIVPKANIVYMELFTDKSKEAAVKNRNALG